MATADHQHDVRPSMDRVEEGCRITVKSIGTGEEKTIERIGENNPFFHRHLHETVTVRPPKRPSALGRPFKIIRIEPSEQPREQ
ncbi:MAG: hypothetical protein M3N59_00400 [bacterium]|nr:hypothetical protein [bacterium]